MDNTFTYVIRSAQKEISTDNTNNCTIRLGGLPQKYRWFEATVSALHVSTNNAVFTTSTFELRTDGLNIINGYDTFHNILNTVGFASLNNTYPQGAYKFKFENTNGKSIRFQLFDDANALLTSNYNSAGVGNFNRSWILILNLVGVE
jgi:hypothetical protein